MDALTDKALDWAVQWLTLAEFAARDGLHRFRAGAAADNHVKRRRLRRDGLT